MRKNARFWPEFSDEVTRKHLYTREIGESGQTVLAIQTTSQNSLGTSPKEFAFYLEDGMNAEEYLEEVVRVARENFHADDPNGSMIVARLGLLVRRVTGVHSMSVGFPRLKDALFELNRRGKLRTGQNSKGAFAFWLPDSYGAPSMAVADNEPHANRKEQATSFDSCYRRLRKTIWLAFVGALPAGRRFINRDTGEVRLGQQATPDPAETWIEILPISADVDKADARAFLESEGQAETTTLSTLDSPKWFHDFAMVLESKDSFLASKWKKRRSHRVIAEVTRWRRENNIPPEHVFEALVPTPTASRVGTSKADDIRQVALDAIATLPTHELLSICLPIRSVVSVLRPELLDNN